MKFDRFRAYALAEGTTSAWAEKTNDEGVTSKTREVVNSWPVEEVAFDGEASGDGETADFNAGETVITKVVFYRGPADSERAVGSVEVGKSGKVSVTCPDVVTA